MRNVAFLSSPELWKHGHGPGHPLKPERLHRTHELLDEYGILSAQNVDVVAPRLASDEELGLFHTLDYIRVVKALSCGEIDVSSRRYNFGPGDNPVFVGMYESEALKVGSALQGAELVINEECNVAFSYGGGLHHGGPDFASGFCVFNDAAVVLNWLSRQGLRSVYVDVDVHHADGVQSAFYDIDQVLTISLHQDGRTLFPGTGSVGEIGSGKGKGFNVNVPLPPFTDDESYVWAFQEIVLPLVKRFVPDILVTQLGVDTHYMDPLANLGLTTHGLEKVFYMLSDIAVRWLALGGGGYNLDLVPRAWALAMGVMAGLMLSDKLPVRYREKYGGVYLHDTEGPAMSEASRLKVHRQVEEVVTQVKELHHI